MGEVYRARDERLQRDVAIKVLPAWAALDADMLRRFETEARAAGGLNHPGILSIHDVGQTETGPFIVSELLEGETLRDRLRRGPLCGPEVLDIGQQVARALAAAHDHGIVHRDVKPENLFLTTDGHVKVLDFGIARLSPHAAAPTTAGGVEYTAVGAVIGTYSYMSPEQAQGLPANSRSDIFSLGAVLYEMVTGRKAFRGESAGEIAGAVVTQEPDPITEGSIALRQVITRCLQKRPVDRFESARDLAVAIGASASASVAPELGRRRSGRRVLLVGAALVVLFGVGLAVMVSRLPGRPSAATGRPHLSSLAVLPLVNFSANADEAYFADSMTEAIIADLARISGLAVTSRTSVMRFKGTDKPMREIARELGVEGLIEASILKVGDRVRITAKLIDVSTDRPIWSDTYEREMHDVLALQSDVARAISHEVSATLAPETADSRTSRAVNPASYEAYLRGRYELNRFTEESLYKAVRHFNDAIASDPTSARGYAGLADAYSAMRSIWVPPTTVMPKAKAAALKAVALDDTLAEAHVALGFVFLYYDWDWSSAEASFAKAIKLNRGLASAHGGYALLLAATNRRTEAIDQVERALKLDPLSPTLRTDAAWVYYLGRRYDVVVTQSRRAIELDAQSWNGYTMLALGYEGLRQYPEAAAALEKARSIDNNSFVLETLGGLYATTGKLKEMRAVLAELAELSKRSYVCPYEVATIYAVAGDRRNTLAQLEKGHQEHADCMPWAGADPKLDLLKNDPEFTDLLRRAGLKP